VVNAGVKVAAANLWAGGARVARLPLGSMGVGLSPFPYALTYGQDEHERLLESELDRLGVKVERRTELVGYEQTGQAVRARLRRRAFARQAWVGHRIRRRHVHGRVLCCRRSRRRAGDQ